MARSAGSGSRRTKRSAGQPILSLPERRIATPNPNLVVVKIGERQNSAEISPGTRQTGTLAKLAKAMAKPGLDRASVFVSTVGKPVYAYSVYVNDPSKLVREDADGRKTIGRFVGGRFRPIPQTTAD